MYFVSGNNNTEKKFVAQLKKNGFKYVRYDEERSPEQSPETPLTDDKFEQIGGSSIKFFARLDDSKHGYHDYSTPRKMYDSRYLRPLFSEVRHNPDCSYKSIYNELIKAGILPRYISALVKDCHNNSDRVKGEIFGSRVANILKIPTAYCFGIKDTETPHVLFSDTIGHDYFGVASIDYIEPGHTIEEFFEMKLEDKSLGCHDSLEKWLQYADRCLQARYPEGIDEESYAQFKKDFVKTYLLRVALFPDTDFAVYNGGIVSEDGTNKFSMMPNTDMEGILEKLLYYGTKSYVSPMRSRTRKTINYCRKYFPEVLDEFMADLEAGHKKRLFTKALEDLYPRSKNNQAVYDNVNAHVEAALAYYKKPSFELLDSLFK